MMPGDVPDTWGDVTLLKALTGYVPDTPLTAGIERFARWYKQTYAS
jgi:UDP-glucuronate 4-epimerase